MLRTALALFFASILTSTSLAAAPPSPEEYFGYPIGADRKLARYDEVVDYLRVADAASDRISIASAGMSTLDNEMLVVVLTSEDNQRNLERYREIGRRLANPDQLADEEALRLIDEGKVFLLVTCTIHSTEVGCTQMATELAWEFATTQNPQKLEWMDEVVLLLMPSINPDGQFMVVDWYEKYVGTPFEGGRMPWLYHHYVGHDNNRDFYMLTQKESQAVNDVLYRDWFPQVFIDEHQMGSTGPRMFVPPQTDPLAPEIHPLIFRQADLIGTNMSFRLEDAGKTGVGHNMIFDSYWPGGTRNTAWWKNVTGLLTEVASARVASPIHIDPGELRGGGKGFPEYKRRANFPSPWEGGWWHLRDIIDYESIATWAAMETCSQYRKEMLANFYRMNRQAIEAGEGGPPYAWVISPDQHDPVAADRLVELLIRHGIRIEQATEPIRIGRTSYPAGTELIPAAQPYRAFLLTMLRPQRYPEVVPHVDGPIIPPYDVTSWSLPISMGVEVEEIEVPLDAVNGLEPIQAPVPRDIEVVSGTGGHLVPHSADSAYIFMNRLLAKDKRVFWLNTESESGRKGDVYIPSGTVEVEELNRLSEELQLPIYPLVARPTGNHLRLGKSRVGLFKPWRASMDEGWTRFVLEQYEFPYVSLSNQDISEGSFRNDVDVLLFPDVEKSVIERGEPSSASGRRRFSPLPDEYSGGIEPDGGNAIKTWVENGGVVVALDSSSQYFIDLFQLPIRDVLHGSNGKSVNAPGTMLRLEVDTSHPLGFGMREEEAGYFASSPAFQTSVPDPRFDRRVVARYPSHRDDIPVSGFIRGEESLERRAVVVDFEIGKGRVVLIGFRAQHRAQPLRTFKLLFNALYLPGLVEEEL